MKICGIVSEYNPFHNGHKYHIDKTKEITNCDLLVCVMSGNFVQRGEPAIIDKWERAKEAVMNGCDIVFELPYIYSVQSANYFAEGAINTLKLANINCLCFGSECNDTEYLLNLLKKDTTIHKNNGISTSKAYEQIYGNLHPNDILGINYLKNIKDTNIIPYCIKRTNDYHNKNLDTMYASATSIREAIKNKQDVSKYTSMHIDNPIFIDDYYPYIKNLLLTLPKEYLKNIFLMDEGLENNLIKNAKLYDTYEEFIQHTISKRYTKSSIQRTLMHVLNQVLKEDKDKVSTLYLRPLAFNQKGKNYLKQLKKNINIVSKFSQLPKDIQDLENKLMVTYHKDYKNKELQYPIEIKETV